MTIHTNNQWEVLETAIRSVGPAPKYEISIQRVYETTNRSAGTLYDWPVHMAEKTWVDTDLFNRAFDVAIRHHSKVTAEDIDEDMLSASYAEAHRIANMRR